MTPMELLVEYFEDYFEEHPRERLKAGKDEEGNIQFKTGDPLLDRWEAQIARGLSPDLTEGMLPADLDNLSSAQKSQSREPRTVDNFADMQKLVDEQSKRIIEDRYKNTPEDRYQAAQKFRLDGGR
jgi:hypothetical protein